ncbi:unnamed protein product [Rotaria sordida]|uniref:Uncharacterized protein n=1 Tax=Rotaria sordida TaxID=392033 RepID=A0A813XK38_9BILA|nr:unnamed protein product [Rotaria sordida]CAF0830024.1 unnamed protein product [Rotaria sordida]CAF0836651.1 unnamed protein product [Rotaria sordida]CAF0837632.1 unnamed protein product [Rotaria sordida]CAF0872690.1 unnamed protein product [Rotaria sordida]
MAKDKSTFGKQLAHFLSKMFWHLNQPVVPTYNFPNQKHSTSSSKTSIKNKVSAKSSYKISPINGHYIHSQCSSRQRTPSIRPRVATLSSIQEE